MILAALAVVAFFLGSIPFGFLFAKAKGVDIRKVGSGNIGATNVNRVLGAKLGFLVFALDVAKGLVPGLAARFLLPQGVGGMPPQAIWFAVGACALLGHVFSPWLGFKGGKGIATGLGMIIASSPWVAAIGFAVFLLVFIPTRYVSLSSILGVASTPFSILLIPGEPNVMIPVYVLLTLFVIWKHRANIERLRAGTESKTTFRQQRAMEPEKGGEG